MKNKRKRYTPKGAIGKMKPPNPFPANGNRMIQYPSNTIFCRVEEDWADSDDGSINGSDHNNKSMSKDETSMVLYLALCRQNPRL